MTGVLVVLGLAALLVVAALGVLVVTGRRAPAQVAAAEQLCWVPACPHHPQAQPGWPW